MEELRLERQLTLAPERVVFPETDEPHLVVVERGQIIRELVAVCAVGLSGALAREAGQFIPTEVLRLRGSRGQRDPQRPQGNQGSAAQRG